LTMRNPFAIATILLTGLLTASCYEGLDFDEYAYQSKLVVDGWIENGDYPTVVLTRSAAYFSTIDSVALRKLAVTRAKVTVSDGETEEILTLKKNEGYYPPYIYQGNELTGKANRTYWLKVELEGKVYEATTTIPPPVQVDAVWWEPAPENDSLGIVKVRFTDDKDMENYYRVFTKKVGENSRFIPVYLSAIGDRYFNGETFTFSVLRGPESLSDIHDDIYFRRGDAIEVKVAAIDCAHFDFWRTLERELYTVGNPFSSSGNEVLSNISGDALGVWGGYNSSVHGLIAE